MFKAFVIAVLIECTFLLSGCARNPGPLVLRDTLGIGDSLSVILKNKYGLLVNIHSTLASADDFFNRKLVFLGYTEGHMYMNLVSLGLEKTHKHLFKGSFCDHEGAR